MRWLRVNEARTKPRFVCVDVALRLPCLSALSSVQSESFHDPLVNQRVHPDEADKRPSVSNGCLGIP